MASYEPSHEQSRVRAILGPTNTGKTHLAVERLLAHGTGMIGLPLRLLAREVYDRMVREKGERACALITGEERIQPEGARYFSCTVEAMPVSARTDFMAVDEIQLAADPDRGHVFTDRILHARGNHETMLLGADTMRPALRALDLVIDAERRERFSQLSYAGPIKITKLPKRSAVVAFSAEEVYAIAELLKRQRGGCAVIMGALSPRTRNAQVALYQSGEVDYVVATDAIGMGLNLDVGHIAFASRAKFDGRRRRLLRADELAQIAGRAGRFRDDGTFGETADCEPFDPETVQRIEEHHFEPLDTLNWRNSDLDWRSLDALIASLRRPAPHPVLRRAPEALDEATLAAMANMPGVRDAARSPAHMRRLWDLCTLPDFRKTGPEAHLRLVQAFHEKLAEPDARIRDDWMFAQVERLALTEGDIDMLQQRLAAIRTWTYAANRSDWLQNAATWRGRTREIEDKLSDALHDKLMQRFVDRRTSALLKTLNAEDDAPADVAADGKVSIGGHEVGQLDGLSFTPDASGRTLEGRALRGAALKALAPVIARRLADMSGAGDAAFSLDHASAHIMLDGAPVARLAGGADWLAPGVELVGAAEAHAASREAARTRAQDWLGAHMRDVLAPLFALRASLQDSQLSGLARGAAYQLCETGAALDLRAAFAGGFSADERKALAAAGVRCGRIAAWLPELLRPVAVRLMLALRAVHDGAPHPGAAPSAASFQPTPAWTQSFLATAGYLRMGPRAVRADMAERLLARLGELRRGADGTAFAIPPEASALIGCTAADFPGVVRALGLKPAARDPESKAVTLWRFAARRTEAPQAAPVSGPFAALSVLTETAPPPVQRRKRRRPRRKAEAT